MSDRREGPEKHQITALEVVWGRVWVRAFTYVTLTVFVVMALWQFRQSYAFALQIGLIGFIIAYILNPLVEALVRLRIRRSLAVVLTYILLLLLFVLGSFLITRVVIETGRFVSLLPMAFDNISAQIGSVSAWFTGLIERLPAFLSDRFGLETSDEQVSEQVQRQLLGILERAAEGINSVLERLITDGPSVLLTGATSIISTTLQGFLIVVTSAYFLYDFPRFTANFRRFIPVRWRPLYGDLAGKVDRAVGGYLRGQLLITTLLGFMIWVGLSLAGVPLALAISFLAAIFNLVPYLGPIIGVMPAVLFGFTVSPFTAVLAILVFIAANQIEGNLLSPLILSRSVRLHPVTVLLAIIAGFGLLGFVGALLAVPVVALVKVLLEEYLLTRPPYQVGTLPGGENGEAGSQERGGEPT